MSRRLATFVATAGMLAGAFALGPTVALAGDPCFHQMDNRPAPSTGRSSQVTLGDCVFTPTVNQVATGTLVTWRNTSTQMHEIVGSNLTWGEHDKLLNPGDTIAWKFDTAGVYAYSCMLHPGMSGTIVVGNALDSGSAPEAVADTASTDSAAAGSGPSVPAVGLAAAAGGLAAGLFLARLMRREPPPIS